MGRGGYNGGSTIIRPGSDWFAKDKPKRAPRRLTEAEKIELDRRNAAKQAKEAAKQAAKQMADQARALAKAERKRIHAKLLEEYEKRRSLARKLELEKRRNDPKYIARQELMRAREIERMSHVIVEFKRKK